MDKTPETHAEFVELLRLDLARRERIERNRQHLDGFVFPATAYEILEDLGKIKAAIAAMDTLWHKENHDYRKASMHLSKLSWDLRKQAQQVALDENNC